MSESTDTEKRRSVVQSLPSDYSDVHPKNYDPEFISDISNKMQVPDSLQAVHNGVGYSNSNSRLSGDWDHDRRRSDMNVPERIMLAGGGQHIGAKPEIRELDFDSLPRGGYSQPLTLHTPPRTLTMEEQFPSADDDDEFEDHRTPKKIPNGTVVVPEPYTPGMSASTSLLLNEEDETTQLRTQMSKLMRRVAVLEKVQGTQASREMWMYSAAVGYFMLKVMFWILRDK